MTFWVFRIHRAVADVDFPLRSVVLVEVSISPIVNPSFELVLNQDDRVLNDYSAMVKTDYIRTSRELTYSNYKARVVTCSRIKNVDARILGPSERPIIQVCDQVFRAVSCRDRVVVGENNGGAGYHVGRLIQPDLRYG